MKCGRVEAELHDTACSYITNRKVYFVGQQGFHEQSWLCTLRQFKDLYLQRLPPFDSYHSVTFSSEKDTLKIVRDVTSRRKHVHVEGTDS